jgi:hypothetical protein
MEPGKERRSKIRTRNGEAGKTNTQKEENLAGTSTDDTIRKNSQATFIITDTKTQSRKVKKKMAGYLRTERANKLNRRR